MVETAQIVAAMLNKAVKKMRSGMHVRHHPRDPRKYLIRESNLQRAGGPRLANNG